MFRELQAFVEFASKSDGLNWKIFVRLMNRFRKTGTYIRPDNAIIETGLAGTDFARSMTVAPVVEDYGNEYGQEEEYEGGENEAIDPEAELTNQERLKEEIELTKYQEFYNIMFT